MDLDQDGHLDILSGSYARLKGGRAGLFQVHWGIGEGMYSAPEALCSSDDLPLIVGTPEDSTDVRVATRVFAVDLDSDGVLDLVSGNLRGTFYMFRGLDEGVFDPRSIQLTDGGGTPLAVHGKSDPFLVDWDSDGDLDLISGSARGGVFAFQNNGSPSTPLFAKSVVLLEPRAESGSFAFGEEGIKGPQWTTRVWVDDFNDDGKLDLLVGDSVRLQFVREGLDELSALRKLAALESESDEESLYAARKVIGNLGTEAELLAELRGMRNRIRQKRAKFLREENTGYVWLILQR